MVAAVENYRQWLCDRIALHDPQAYGYHELCTRLMVTPFISQGFDDSLRVEEALYLRRSYARTMNGVDENEKRTFYRSLGPASFLEVMVILVEQMAFEVHGIPLIDDNPASFFLELLDNCGLGYLKDEAFVQDPDQCQEEFVRITKTINDKAYLPNGEGGFYPLEHPTEDMRTVGLLQQLDRYLVEKYHILD